MHPEAFVGKIHEPNSIKIHETNLIDLFEGTSIFKIHIVDSL